MTDETKKRLEAARARHDRVLSHYAEIRDRGGAGKEMRRELAGPTLAELESAAVAHYAAELAASVGPLTMTVAQEANQRDHYDPEAMHERGRCSCPEDDLWLWAELDATRAALALARAQAEEARQKLNHEAYVSEKRAEERDRAEREREALRAERDEARHALKMAEEQHERRLIEARVDAENLPDARVAALTAERDGLRKMAEHMRHCRVCGSEDVMECCHGKELWEEARMDEKPRPAPAALPANVERLPVCERCNDTHSVHVEESGRTFMCTRCPVPCDECRSRPQGAYCRVTPCACECHKKESPRG